MGRLFTRPVVRGVQLGLGLLLVRSARQWSWNGFGPGCGIRPG
ncbi:MAG: hypothetical protein ACP5NB_05650 [Chloroflexia bacterium]